MTSIKKLLVLSMKNNQIRTDGFQSILNNISSLPKLTNLGFDDNLLTPAAITSLGQSFSFIKNLQILELNSIILNYY